MIVSQAHVVAPKQESMFFIDGQMYEVHDGAPGSPDDELRKNRIVIACVQVPTNLLRSQ